MPSWLTEILAVKFANLGSLRQCGSESAQLLCLEARASGLDHQLGLYHYGPDRSVRTYPRYETRCRYDLGS